MISRRYVALVKDEKKLFGISWEDPEFIIFNNELYINCSYLSATFCRIQLYCNSNEWKTGEYCSDNDKLESASNAALNG